MGVCTADYFIEPVEKFREMSGQGFALAGQYSTALVTFGVTKTVSSAAYAYLQLLSPFEGVFRRVRSFTLQAT